MEFNIFHSAPSRVTGEFSNVIALFLRGSYPGRGEDHRGPEIPHYQRPAESRSQDEETEEPRQAGRQRRRE